MADEEQQNGEQAPESPDTPEAPHVRPLQRKQARTTLPWAARALGLPPPLPPA